MKFGSKYACVSLFITLPNSIVFSESVFACAVLVVSVEGVFSVVWLLFSVVVFVVVVLSTVSSGSK